MRHAHWLRGGGAAPPLIADGVSWTGPDDEAAAAGAATACGCGCGTCAGDDGGIGSGQIGSTAGWPG